MSQKMKQQTRNMIEKANNQQEFLAELIAFTEAAKAKTERPAMFQEMALTHVEEIAVENGRPAGGNPGLADTIMAQQHHKIAQWGNRAFCLSEKQMAVIVRENWGYLKA